MAIDLSPRTTGLLPWWVLAAVLLAGGLGIALLAWQQRAKGAEAAGFGGLFLVWLLFFWRPLLTPAHVPRNGGDLNSFFFPLHSFAAQTVQQGELPLWNPTLFSGMSHWANYQAGVLYPLNWLAYLLARPFTYGTLELLTLVHYLIASSGSYALARWGLRLPRLPALLAGIVFPYSGFLVAHLGHYSMVAVAVWVPWLWLALTGLAQKPSGWWSAATALAIFLMATGGHQQTLFYALITSGLWWLACLVRWQPAIRDLYYSRNWFHLLSTAGKQLLRVGFPLTTGLLLAAPALLPSVELARRSVRGGGLSYEQASEFAVQPIALLNFVLPRAFGDNPSNWWGPWASGEVWAYAGVVTLIFAALGLARAREPLRWALATLGLLALFYALGPATPLHGWAYRFLPFADLFRAPARSLLYVDLALALLAAMGLAAVTNSPQSSSILQHSKRILLFTLGALALLITPLFLLAIVTSSTPTEPLVRSMQDLIVLLLWLGLTALWFWAVGNKLSPLLFTPLAITLIVFDLFGVTENFNPTSEDLLTDFRHPEIVQLVRETSTTTGPWRMLGMTIRWQPSSAAVHGLEDAGGLYDPMQPAASARALDCARRFPPSPLLDLLNVRFLVLREEAGSPGDRFSRRLTTPRGLVVWENPTALPRVWLAGRVTFVEQETALQRICAEDFDPRQEVLLTGNGPAADPSVEGRVQLNQLGLNRLSLEVETTAPAYVVLAVSSDPGWKATLDGKATPILTAYGIYQAVWVPAGHHTVVFSYWPVSLTGGLMGALLGLVGMILLLLLALRERSREGRRTQTESALHLGGARQGTSSASAPEAGD